MFLPICLFVGSVSLIVFLSCRSYRRRLLDVLGEMQSANTYRASDLGRMCENGFEGIVEVDGAVTCDQPIISPVAQASCCCLKVNVARETTKSRVVSGNDSRGNWTSRTEYYTDWDTIFERVSGALFKVNDETGYVLVDPEGSDAVFIDDVSSHTQKEPEPWFEDEARKAGSGPYRVREDGLLCSGHLYVRGFASGRNGEATIRQPVDESFVVSRKTEAELTQQYTRRAGSLHTAEAISLAALVLAAIVGVMSLPSFVFLR